MAIRWGVIGCGGIAARRTIPEGITKAANSRLAAVMDVNKEKAKEVSREYGVKGCTAEEEILGDSRIDAVYIATPTRAHFSQVMLAAKRGKHVLCEKPLGLTAQECAKMISACRKAKVRLGVGFMMRYHALHKRIREMIKAGELGRIVFARAQLSCWYPFIKGAWRQDPELGGGGSLIDLGSHCIDLIEFLTGSKAVSVSCFADTLVQDYQAEDSAAVMLKLGNGACGFVDNCFSIPDASSKNALEIYGSRGSVIAEGSIGQAPSGDAVAYLEKEAKGYEAAQQRTRPAAKKIKYVPANTYRQEIEDFSRCIEKGLPAPVPGEDGLWSQKVVLACYRSAKEKKVINIGSSTNFVG